MADWIEIAGEAVEEDRTDSVEVLASDGKVAGTQFMVMKRVVVRRTFTSKIYDPSFHFSSLISATVKTNSAKWDPITKSLEEHKVEETKEDWEVVRQYFVAAPEAPGE